MTAGIIAPPAAPGGSNPPPPAPGMPNNPAPPAPVATAAAQSAGDPIIDLKALMTAGIIAGSMKLNEAVGIPQPDGSPPPPVNSGALAVAGIVGGQAAGAQATVGVLRLFALLLWHPPSTLRLKAILNPTSYSHLQQCQRQAAQP